MRGEAATRTRCSAARWFRSLVLALSKCLVAAAPKIRPVVSIAPAGCVAGPADCKLLDWLPHFLRRERFNGRVAMQMQLDWQKNLPLLQMVVGVRENLRSRPGGCFQATKSTTHRTGGPPLVLNSEMARAFVLSVRSSGRAAPPSGRGFTLSVLARLGNGPL